MKILSLKLDNHIFDETEEVVAQLKISRNRYINEAVSMYNSVQKRRLLKKTLVNESALTTSDSMEILREFDWLIDGN